MPSTEPTGTSTMGRVPANAASIFFLLPRKFEHTDFAIMTSNNIKLSVAVLVLVTAGTIYHFTSDTGADDSGDDTKTEWFCVACNKPFVLTGAELAKSMRLQEREVTQEKGPTDGPKARGRGNVTTVNIARCPNCNEWHGEAARTCGACGEIFLAKTPKGETAICPKCSWDPHTGQTAEGERATTGRE